MKKELLLLLSCYLLAASYCFGQQWVQQNSTTVQSLNDIYCVSADTCYVAGNGTLLKTTDGGATWFLQDSGINGADPLQAIVCIDENVCLTAGNDAYKTTDGGNSWVIKTHPMGGITSFFFLNDSIGYAVGGSIIKTTDTGETWNWVGNMIGLSGGVKAVHFTDENIGYAVEQVFPDGKIFKTTDGGDFWTQTHLESGVFLWDMIFTNDSVGFAVGDAGTILKTTDYGNNWTPQIAGTTNPLTTIHCVDEDTCYVAGTGNIAGATGTMLKTTDGGNSWTLDTSGVVITTYNTVFFPAPTVGYTVGNGGVIIKTTSGVGIYEVNKQVNINIYPNPATGKFTVQGASGEIKVYDLFGRLLLRSNEEQIDMSSYPAGLYIWKVGSERGKIILE